MTTDQRTARTYLYAIMLTGFAATGLYGVGGFSLEGLDSALRSTGRVAFLVLITAFAARPLQDLLRKPWTAKLLRNRRQLGVAFAGIHTGHLVFILYKVYLLPDLALVDIISHSGIVVYGFILAMLVTSFQGPARAIGPTAWKVLHKLGLYVLFVAFLVSQVPRTLDALELINAILIGLALLAIAARVAAFIQRQRR
ncbi:MAG: ferric reductase-like transmembrane domain-containing protein [Woeseiaceae bacterium]|nr:ferric reductase-like transmembrane domain-containing protein [Woeseiaceae bacterium]